MVAVFDGQPKHPDDEQADHVSDFHLNLHKCINAVLAPMQLFGKAGQWSRIFRAG